MDRTTHWRCWWPLGLLLGLACCVPPLAGEAVPGKAREVAPAPILFQSSATASAVKTRRQDLTETLFGVRVADPYRWLEDGDSEEVKAWVAEQNALTEATLKSVPEHARIKARLEELLEIGQVSLPGVVERPDKSLRLFYTRREGKQNQPVLYVRDGVDGEDRVLLDPNQLSGAGTIALDWYYPSWDGSLIAYGLSEDGSENSVLQLRNVDTGKDLKDKISRTRYASVCWKPDNKTFYYARFPAPGSVPDDELTYHRKIYEHQLGRDPEQDPMVFGQGRKLTDFPGCSISPSGRWLAIRVHEGWSKSEIYLADTSVKPLKFVELTRGKEHLYTPYAHDDVLYVTSNEGASRYQLFAVDPLKPQREHWRTLIAEHAKDVLSSVERAGGALLVGYLSAGASRLERFDLAGKSRGAVALPGIGSSNGFSGTDGSSQVFLDFQSFAKPTSVLQLDLKSGKQRTWAEVSAPIKPEDFEVRAASARSKDGTKVPYLMVFRRGTKLNSRDNPTLLYGYGGFNASLTPAFSRTSYVLLERGGVYVQANLRGGGEFGEDWHRAGQLDKKQNVFDDFSAVARHLQATGVTRPERLAIHGRSNGGLLTAAALVQNPELYAAVVSGVPLTDMLRYHKFLIGKLWIPEYGSPDVEADFRTLYAYSPYHHVEPGTHYPAVLLTTAISDSRVDPMHARKMAAALQFAQAGEQPILLRSETQAGHGAGKPMSKVAEEYADMYTFVLSQLGVLGQP